MLATDLSITTEELSIATTTASSSSLKPISTGNNNQCQVLCKQWCHNLFHTWQGLLITSLIGFGSVWFFLKKYKK